MGFIGLGIYSDLALSISRSKHLPHLAPIHKFHLPQVTVLPIGAHLEKYYTHIKTSRNGNQRKMFPNCFTKITQILNHNHHWRLITFPLLIPQTTAPKNMSHVFHYLVSPRCQCGPKPSEMIKTQGNLQLYKDFSHGMCVVSS